MLQHDNLTLRTKFKNTYIIRFKVLFLNKISLADSVNTRREKFREH